MSQKSTYEELFQRMHHLKTQIKKDALYSDVEGSKTSKLDDFKSPKRSEENLRAVKEMLQLVMDNIPQFIFWKDRNSVYLGCNQNFARVAGVGRPEGIMGKTDYDLPWKKEEADFFRECDRRVMENDCPEYHIIEPQFQAGSRQAWVDTNKIPLHDHEGNVVGIMGTYEDITDRKKTEELLEFERRRLFMLLETFPGYIYLLSPDYSIYYANRYFIDHFGEPQGRYCYEVLWGKNEACKVCPTFKVFDTKKTKISEWSQTPDGRIYQVYDYPFIDSDGSELVLEIGVDISEMKKAEEKIHKLNETLEQRVAKRTAELESRTQQLQQLALELSDAEDRERKNIASILHDDFQQQLAYIKLELSLLGKSADLETGKRLRNIEGLIGESIRQSCDLSYEINPPALSRNGLLAALNVLATDLKNRHGFEVRIHSQADAEPDSHTLAVILYRAAKELLINVVKHADVDSAKIDIFCKKRIIYIRVKDSGCGFDYQAVKANQGKGTGFGLFNIEDRITFLGGSMKLETSPEKGCCVELSVPKDLSKKTFRYSLKVGDIAEHQEMTDDGSVQTAQQSDLNFPIRVLLADDHHLMREALSNLLQSCKNLSIVGHAVNGREAVQLADRLKPDVILMDVTMPELDGFEATAEITRNNPTIRIIGLSMHNDTDTRNKMLEAGASAYLTKSGSPNTLIDTINHLYAEITQIKSK